MWHGNLKVGETLYMLKDLNFLNECEIPTSLFNLEYATNDKTWGEIVNKFNYSKNVIHKNNIPKIIHFIWLGSRLPEWYYENIKKWQAKLPEFHILFWDDWHADDFIKNKQSENLYNQSSNFGVKSDILRYEILNKIGGLYVDTDFLCINPKLLNLLHETQSFYAGICLEKNVQFNNGIMASAPNSMILKSLINSLIYRINGFNSIECKHTRVLFQTGPWALTDAILNNMECDFIPLPSTMFHPFPAAFRNDGVDANFIKSTFTEYTAACHLWHASWQGKSQGYFGDLNEF